MSRLLAALLLFVSTAGAAMTIDPVLRCDGAVVVLDTSVRELKGDPQPVVNDFVTRLRQFVGRICGPQTEVRELLRPGARLGELEPDILRMLDREAPAVAIVHGPYADIEAGAAPAGLLDVYRRILGACDQGRTTCVIAGQQPVNALPAQAAARQLDLEREAERALSGRYLPLHRHFRSELASRQLMTRLDHGDGRVLSERGHLLLFTLLQKRLIALSMAARP